MCLYLSALVRVCVGACVRQVVCAGLYVCVCVCIGWVVCACVLSVSLLKCGGVGVWWLLCVLVPECVGGVFVCVRACRFVGVLAYVWVRSD